MEYRQLGQTGLKLSTIGFGAFKIGRNQKTKYAQPYDLPSDADVGALLDGLLAAGVNYFDTAPAYGTSEDRLGRHLHKTVSDTVSAANGSRECIVLSTKVGETFEDGQSTYNFSPAAITASIERSLRRLCVDVLDLVFIHSDGRDQWILQESGAAEALLDAKQRGLVRAVGLSGKTVEGAHMALDWADAIMVEYNLENRSHEAVIAEAHRLGVGVVVKKGLASGTLPPAEAVKFVLSTPGVTSLVVGSLNLAHLQDNINAAGRL